MIFMLKIIKIMKENFLVLTDDNVFIRITIKSLIFIQETNEKLSN